MTREPDPPAQLLVERLRAAADQQPVVAMCALCPEWRVEGTAAETRDAATAHRKEHHPDTFRNLKRPGRKFLRKNMTKEREIEINEERRVRIRALGLNIDVDDPQSQSAENQ